MGASVRQKVLADRYRDLLLRCINTLDPCGVLHKDLVADLMSAGVLVVMNDSDTRRRRYGKLKWDDVGDDPIIRVKPTIRSYLLGIDQHYQIRAISYDRMEVREVESIG